MPKKMEGVPSEPAKEQKEEFEEFEIEIGHRMYEDDGAWQQVVDIVPDKGYPGGGYLELHSITDNRIKSKHGLSFDDVVEYQKELKWAKPVLPENIETESRSLSPRHQAMLKQLTPIENRLREIEAIKDPSEEWRKERRDLLRSRATIIWEVSSQLPPSPSQPDSESTA